MAKYETMLVTSATLDEEATAALVGKAFIGDCAEQVPQMHKAGGTGSHTGYLCPLGQVSGRIALFHVLRRGGDVREKQIGKLLIIHNILFLLKRDSSHI